MKIHPRVSRKINQACLFAGRFNSHPFIRLLVGRVRFFYFSHIYKVRHLNSNNARANTVAHNMQAFKDFSCDFAMPRMSWLTNAVTSIEFVNSQSKILVIGPRTESDLLRLIGAGFTNVIGLDLISYSPRIILGDMHDMPFDDSSFDVVICGWTLSYSTRPTRVAEEILRVATSSALIAIGVQYSNLADKPVDCLLDLEDDVDRINSVSQILQLFGSHISNVYFSHDAPLKTANSSDIVSLNGLASSQVMTVFQLK